MRADSENVEEKGMARIAVSGLSGHSNPEPALPVPLTAQVVWGV